MSVKPPDFVERRKEYRLPFFGKVIMTDGTKSVTAYAANISRGGAFVMTLDPYPIDTICHVSVLFPEQSQSLCFKAKAAHIVFDRHRCEVECGMGLQFVELAEFQRSILNVHILNQKAAYLELKQILAASNPNAGLVARFFKRLPHLNGLDLLALRYRVNRVCTLFEANGEMVGESVTDKLSA